MHRRGILGCVRRMWGDDAQIRHEVSEGTMSRCTHPWPVHEYHAGVYCLSFQFCIVNVSVSSRVAGWTRARGWDCREGTIAEAVVAGHKMLAKFGLTRASPAL